MMCTSLCHLDIFASVAAVADALVDDVDYPYLYLALSQSGSVVLSMSMLNSGSPFTFDDITINSLPVTGTYMFLIINLIWY